MLFVLVLSTRFPSRSHSIEIVESAWVGHEIELQRAGSYRSLIGQLGTPSFNDSLRDQQQQQYSNRY